MQASAGRLPPAGEHVLALGTGSGLLALLAAGAGAGRVTAVERSRSLYRMAKQVGPAAGDMAWERPGGQGVYVMYVIADRM